MALWGRNNSELELQQEKEQKREEEARKNVENRFKQMVEEINDIPGVIVKVEGEGFLKNTEYKMYLENESYVFIRNFEKNLTYPERRYLEYLETTPIYKDISGTVCKLLPNKKLPQQSKEYKNVIEKKVEEVIFTLEDMNGVTQISIERFNQDFSPLKKLMRTLNIKNFYNVINLPLDRFLVKVENGAGYCDNGQYQMFRADDNLYLVGHASFRERMIYIATIEVADILYYKSEGALRYEQQISGGGGMGINYGSAVVGGLLFGEAGAMIGSRRKEEIKQIETKTITHDSRIITLVIRKKEMTYTLSFNINNEVAFDWLIPEKKYDYVIGKRRLMYEKG